MRPRRKTPNLIAFLDRFPPCLCRLVARKGRRPLTHREIAQASGLSLDQISRWSHLTSWATIRAQDIQKFALACGVNHVQSKRLTYYLRNRKMAHLFRNGMPGEQRLMLNKLISVASGKEQG